jgi:hypothetical protein
MPVKIFDHAPAGLVEPHIGPMTGQQAAERIAAQYGRTPSRSGTKALIIAEVDDLNRLSAANDYPWALSVRFYESPNCAWEGAWETRHYRTFSVAVYKETWVPKEPIVHGFEVIVHEASGPRS